MVDERICRVIAVESDKPLSVKTSGRDDAWKRCCKTYPWPFKEAEAQRRITTCILDEYPDHIFT